MSKLQIRRIVDFLARKLGFSFRRVHRSCRLKIGKNVRMNGACISVTDSSSIEIADGCQLKGWLKISGRSSMLIGEGCVIRNVDFSIADGSNVKIGAGAILDYSSTNRGHIIISNGIAQLGERTNIKANILVRFGGRLSIGQYSGIGTGSEIRCEESITIGDFALMSYGICIYDTNTHSVEWGKRRERIESGYPIGAGEVERPKTAPIIIGDDVWIGKEATITKGARIGNRCIIGIRAAVGGAVLPDDCIAVSPPPRIIQRSGPGSNI